jgi:hypothetical protein
MPARTPFMSVLALAPTRAFAVLASAMLIAITPTLAASLPSGQKTITLVTASGERLALGKATFTPDGDGAKIVVKLDSSLLGEEFLSMRPFNCLPDPKEMWCHLAYPYGIRNRVTADDLTDLEYALLFLFKPPTGYGIDAWNGLYFELALGADGAITGELRETDLNVLAVTPEGEFPRPIARAALTKVDPGTHRFARVEIK